MGQLKIAAHKDVEIVTALADQPDGKKSWNTGRLWKNCSVLKTFGLERRTATARLESRPPAGLGVWRGDKCSTWNILEASS